jgi:chaperonin GroES
MTFRPTQDRVLIRRAELETKTSSGLYIPDTQGEKANQGTVMAMGPGRTTKDGAIIPIALNIGDLVMFGGGAGTPVKVEGQDYLVIREDEIIAVVEKQQVDN